MESGAATYSAFIQSSVKVPMDDGVLLDATIGYPADLSTEHPLSGNFPVILQQSPPGS